MSRNTTIFATITVCTLSYGATVNAGIFGDGLSGAFTGAMLGRLIDGRDGAATGAIIGGLIGAGESASRERRAQQEQEAVQQRKAQWAAAQQAEQDRIRAAQPAPQAQPVSSVDRTLLVETQKSLIRLGYEPGDIGSEGDALTNAVIAYQQSNGLPETGELSQDLLTHLLRNGG